MSEGEKSYEGYAAKEPTDLHEHLSDWIQEKTGYDPASAKSKQQAFLKGVQLGALLRMDHQASPENQERRRTLAERTAKAKEEAKAAKPAKAAAAPAKGAGKGTAKATEATAKTTGGAKRQRGPKPAQEAATAAF